MSPDTEGRSASDCSVAAFNDGLVDDCKTSELIYITASENRYERKIDLGRKFSWTLVPRSNFRN